MSLVYDRVISVLRRPTSTDAGVVAYGGVVQSDYVPIFTGLAATIQQKPSSTQNPVNVPTDAVKQLFKIIFLLPNQLDTGAIETRDRLVDENGIEYQITSLRWCRLNWQCQCESMGR